MSTMASQITSLTIVYSTITLSANHRKYPSSESLAFVRGIHRWPVNSPNKWAVTGKMFPFEDVIMVYPHTDMIFYCHSSTGYIGSQCGSGDKWLHLTGDYGQLVPKTTRTQDNSHQRRLVPRITRTQDDSYPRQLVPRTTRTLSLGHYITRADNGNQLINHIAKGHTNEDLFKFSLKEAFQVK